jgi:hypothetical protein
MRRMTALTMIMVMCAAVALAQVRVPSGADGGLSLPGLKTEFRAGLTTAQLKEALLPQISVSGTTEQGVGIFGGRVPLGDGAYYLTLGLQNERLVMIGLASLDSAGNATDSQLRAWFDQHVAVLHSPYHRTDTDNRGKLREVWSIPGVRWTRGSTAAAHGRKVPLYMVEFTQSSE